MKAAGIIGVGKALPSQIITNEDIKNMGLDTTDEWIVTRTGIKERRIADKNTTTSDLAYLASAEAIKNAGLKPDDIDLLIVATTSPDYPVFPSTACLVQNKLGLKTVGAFDISAACTGFTFALTTGAQFVQTGFAKNVLVVGADCLSKFVDWQDRSVCILFGDGAGAVVLSEVKPGFGVLSSDIHANGADAMSLIVKAGGTKEPITKELIDEKKHFIYMDGKAVFKLAVNRIIPTLNSALEKAHLKDTDINFFIPHQANIRIIEAARERLKLKPEQVYINLDKYGNTSAASIPIALAEVTEKKLIKEGDIVATVGFGAGFTWGANIIKWGGKP
jgi:3-oxoacyl-[acyl-carrier-protein] synthase-3